MVLPLYSQERPLLMCMMCSAAQSCLSLVTPWTVACQAPLSMEFPRQEYWRGLPFPSPGIFSDPGVKPVSLASPTLAGEFFTTESPGKPCSPNQPNCCCSSRLGEGVVRICFMFFSSVKTHVPYKEISLYYSQKQKEEIKFSCNPA